jgi:hypothetical protein
MKRIAWLSCGMVLCVAVTAGLAQQPGAEDTVGTDEAAASTDEATIDPALEAARALDLDDLREAYLKRMEEKAALMDDAELKAALEEVDEDIAELTAQRRLEEAQAILEEIAEKHPQTQAGAHARAMLEAHSNNSYSPFGTFTPASSTSARSRNAPVATGGYQPL